MNLFKSARDFGSEHGSTLCVIGALVGLGLTIYETWKVRPKVEVIMDEHAKKEDEIAKNESLSEEEKKKAHRDNNIETAKKVGVTVLPLAGAAFGTASLSVAGHVIDAKKIGGLTAAVQMSDMAYQKLENKTRELLGDEKAQEIKTEIAKDDVKKQLTTTGLTNTDFDDAILNHMCVLQPRNCRGSDIIYDLVSGRLFFASKQEIEQHCIKANLDLSSGREPYLTYNEFERDYIGLPNADGLDYVGFGGYASVQEQSLLPNLGNPQMIGDHAVIVLDWINRPTSYFK